jgi:hypothetical protein
MPLTLRALAETYAICRLPSDATVPSWATASPFFAITHTPNELCLVCLANRVPPSVQSDPGWRCLQVVGTFKLCQVGVLASLAGPLAGAAVSIFAISTFDTDYLLVKDRQLTQAVDALREYGHRILDEGSL